MRRITNEVNGNLLSEFTYERDVAAGRITTWTQAASGEPTKTYTFGYDATNQLTSATLTVSGQPDEVTTYSYDAAGNRLSELTDGVGSSYSYNAVNQLTSIEGATPPEATYQWDAQDRLVQTAHGTTVLTFGYDGWSRLVSSTTANGATVSEKRYMWDGDDLVAETGSGGFVAKQFFTQGTDVDPGSPLGAFFYARDHLGSVRELTDGDGSIRARYAYSPFGIRTQVAGDVNSAFGFTELLEQHDGLLAFARYRGYDANVGRWMSRDPLGELAGARDYDFTSQQRLVHRWYAGSASEVNLYGYALNDAVNRRDPSGKQSIIDYGEGARRAYRRYGNSMHNGRGDAYKHCIASCLVAQNRGAWYAALLGWLNEKYSDLFKKQPRSEREMDDHNNACGRDYGRDDNADCSLRCLSAVENGELNTLY